MFTWIVAVIHHGGVRGGFLLLCIGACTVRVMTFRAPA